MDAYCQDAPHGSSAHSKHAECDARHLSKKIESARERVHKSHAKDTPRALTMPLDPANQVACELMTTARGVDDAWESIKAPDSKSRAAT